MKKETLTNQFSKKSFSQSLSLKSILSSSDIVLTGVDIMYLDTLALKKITSSAHNNMLEN